MKLLVHTPSLAIVIPAKAGIQCTPPTLLDFRLLGNDGGGASVALRFHALQVARSAVHN